MSPLYQKQWEAILSIIELETSSVSFNTWFKDTELIDIEEAEKNLEICPCIDEERIREEMTEEEYDAYRHGRLNIED